MFGNEDRLIADEEVVFRSTDKEYILHNGEIKLQAFLVRANGKDDDGLSVTQEAVRSIGQLREATGDLTGKKVFCCLIVSDVRQVALSAEYRDIICRQQLDVVADPKISDSYHCLIVNTPKSDFDKAYKRRIAEQLAEKAYEFKP